MREMAARKDREYIYVEGNTLRRAEAQTPLRKEGAHTVSEGTLANRERSLQMNLGYVIFLTLAAVICVAVCVNYLKLQASYTTLQKTSTRLETQLCTLKISNDTEYNRVVSSVDLEEIKERAIGRLGMVYKTSDQIVTYEVPDNDYVRQFQAVPD